MKKSKISIVFVIQSLKYGGAETSLFDICKSINTDLFDITIITFWKGDILEKEFETLSSIKLINLNCLSRYDIRILPKLLLALKQEKPDIIHTHLPIAGIYSRLCNKVIKAKIVTTQHSVKYINNLYHKIDRLTAKWNYHYVANSEFTKKFLLKYNYVKNEKISIIPLGIDFSKFNNSKENKGEIYNNLNIPEKAFIIGHIGSFKKQKGHKYIIEIAKKIVSCYSNIYFILVGHGYLFNSIKNLSQKSGVSSHVRFVGVKNNISDYLNIMDIFIQPSISESFGVSILEAMYMKTPVVAFKTDAIPELVKHNKTGLLVQKFNEEEMTKAILYLFENPEIRMQLKTDAFNFVKKYSIVNTTRILEKFYMGLKKKNEKN